MGGAIACGMAKGSVIRPEDITVTARTPASLDRIRAVYPEITVFTDNRTAVGGADLIIIAVKPWQIESVVEEIRGCVEPGRTVIASVVAGVAFRQLSSMFYPVLAEEDAGGSGGSGCNSGSRRICFCPECKYFGTAESDNGGACGGRSRGQDRDDPGRRRG